MALGEDTYGELAELAHAMGEITERLLSIENEPPPRSDALARLGYVTDVLARYREGVAELNGMLHEAFDRVIES